MPEKTQNSIETKITELVIYWLKEYGLECIREKDSLNTEIDRALLKYESKSGGKGGNRPDFKLLLEDQHGHYWPILIEAKGYKNKLEKLDVDGNIANSAKDGKPNYTNINNFAVNGAVHYANAILHHTNTYSDVIAIGITGHIDSTGQLKPQIGVYYVGRDLGIAQRIDEYSDLSFLAPKNFNDFVEKVKNLNLTSEELEKIREKRGQEIDTCLTRLNNEIFNEYKGLISERDHVYITRHSATSVFSSKSRNRHSSRYQKIWRVAY